MAIIQQCKKCEKIGKKIYCKDCTKSIDYFDIFKYDNNKNNGNRSDNNELVEKIKAYTWNDVIEFVKDKYFYDYNDLYINCEKEFAFIEKKINDKLNPNGSGYKIYINKDISPTNSSTVSEKNITDIIDKGNI